LTAQGSLLSSHSDRILLESASGDWGGSGDDRPFVRPFRYALDPLCLSACLCYAINRWLIKPVCTWPFLHDHFNDLFLIPPLCHFFSGSTDSLDFEHTIDRRQRPKSSATFSVGRSFVKSGVRCCFPGRSTISAISWRMRREPSSHAFGGTGKRSQTG
jgi:hypothetical protein